MKTYVRSLTVVFLILISSGFAQVSSSEKGTDSPSGKVVSVNPKEVVLVLPDTVEKLTETDLVALSKQRDDLVDQMVVDRQQARKAAAKLSAREETAKLAAARQSEQAKLKQLAEIQRQIIEKVRMKATKNEKS